MASKRKSKVPSKHIPPHLAEDQLLDEYIDGKIMYIYCMPKNLFQRLKCIIPRPICWYSFSPWKLFRQICWEFGILKTMIMQLFLFLRLLWSMIFSLKCLCLVASPQPVLYSHKKFSAKQKNTDSSTTSFLNRLETIWSNIVGYQVAESYIFHWWM